MPEHNTINAQWMTCVWFPLDHWTLKCLTCERFNLLNELSNRAFLAMLDSNKSKMMTYQSPATPCSVSPPGHEPHLRDEQLQSLYPSAKSAQHKQCRSGRMHTIIIVNLWCHHLFNLRAHHFISRAHHFISGQKWQHLWILLVSHLAGAVCCTIYTSAKNS